VVYQGKELSYRELNGRANQLANYLRRKGVGAESVVAICMERSLEMAVGLLGILKAGGAYLPLDPELPAERLRYMLEDAQARVILTQAHLVGRAGEWGGRFIDVEGEWERIAGEPESNPEKITHPGNLAYVIYTSGSTGKPKGVMVAHLNLMNHMFWMEREFPLPESGRFLQRSALAFDTSFWEFFAPWMRGAKVILLPTGTFDVETTLRTIDQEKITRLQFIPTALMTLLDNPDFTNRARSLQLVFCGGEALPAEIPAKFFDHTQAEFHNIYGPTEVTIISTFYRITRGETFGVNVPIGKPIANTKAYVMDSEMALVPCEVGGELYLGGEGLARGYTRRADLTAEKFLPHPFSETPGARIYRTGDRVRWLPSGNLEFLGRIDHQVKIRGYRIELGEIEAALHDHEEVEQALVLVREDQPGVKQLVGYVVSRNGMNQASSGKLRDHLKRRLPEYMVPRTVMLLEKMPLTPNGKVDRKALPRPEVVVNEDKYVGPRSDTEKILCKIWSEVLGIERVGVEDDFFELGGHSLLAARVIARVHTMLAIDLPLRSLFKANTIAALAPILEEARNVSIEFTKSRIKRIDRSSYLVK
jgi:amino acid adenylation domain-containing protein